MLVLLRKKERKGPLSTTSPASAANMPSLSKGTALQLGVGVWMHQKEKKKKKKTKSHASKTPWPEGCGLGVVLQGCSKTHP